MNTIIILDCVYLVASQLVYSATLLIASIVSQPLNIALVFQVCQKGVSTETMETRLDLPLLLMPQQV